MKRIIEMRTYPFKLEIRSEENQPPKITGYSAVYDQLSDDLGGFREKIEPGFFAKAIGRDDVRALFNHDDNLILARTVAETLMLSEDDNGLFVEIIPPDTSYANDLLVSIKRGDISQMSFQWQTDEDNWDSSDKNNVIRTLIKIKRLWDVSPVTFPAYPQTSLDMRNTPESRSAKEVYKNYLDECQETKSRKEAEDRSGQELMSIRRRKLELMEKQ